MLARYTRVRWFVTGVIDRRGDGDAFVVNCAHFYRFAEGEIAYKTSQKKHHRWCLDKQQVDQYSLGRVLNRKDYWWEHIALHPRECHFYRINGGAVLAALVCEDLARHDPVMPLLRAVGPNLVVALLMDGPQLTVRWPARHATVLADDPGCSVLTLTSLGMVRRSRLPFHGDARQIALWKEPGGGIIELKLPTGDQGLLLTIDGVDTTQLTFDGRSDGGVTPRLKLIDATGIRVQSRDCPPWLGLD